MGRVLGVQTVPQRVRPVDVARLLAQPPDHVHAVQLYEDDALLCDRIASYLAPGLRTGEPAIVIAEDSRRAAIRARLEVQGVDVSAALESGDLVALDAHATLALFLAGDELSWERFERVIGRVIDELQARRPGKRLRAYGEMVDVLWRAGKRTTALELEEMWNRLAQTRAFALLCAYRTGPALGTAERDGRDGLDAACAAHSHVLPTERELELEGELARQRELERALRDALDGERAAREAAQHNLRFNDLFAGMLAHDLRNPLGTITMGASQLARTSRDDRTTRAAERILTSAERMALMIDQLLDFMRIRAGNGLPLRPAATELAGLCARIKSEAERADPAARITLNVQADTSGCWDAERLRHAIATLIDNALVHGAPGREVEIELDGAAPEAVTIAVRNGGPIAPEIEPVIFEPLRGEQKRRNSQGLGLGLFLAKQAVEAHGGSIEARSTQQHGTTFRIVLPRAATTQAAPAEAAG